MTQRRTRGNSPYEKKQSENVARAAMEAMKPGYGEHPMVGQQRARTVIAKGEDQMSISASKKREASRSPSYLKKPRP